MSARSLADPRRQPWSETTHVDFKGGGGNGCLSARAVAGRSACTVQPWWPEKPLVRCLYLPHACSHACSHVCIPPSHVGPGVTSAPVSVWLCNAFVCECDACFLVCPHVHTQPRRSAVTSWCFAKKSRGKGNSSFVVPGKLKNTYSCRLSAVCGAEVLHLCSAHGHVGRCGNTQPRRPGTRSGRFWWFAKRG